MTTRLPPLSCLDHPRDQLTLFRATEQERKEIMQSCLRELKLNAQITEVVCDSGVLRYSLHLSKSNCLMSLSAFEHKIASFFGVEHIQLSLMQGRLFDIGIEIPLESPSVLLREIVSSAPFQKTIHPSFAIGKGIGGNLIVGTTDRIHHLIIAGKNSTETNLFLKSMLISLLYKTSPDELKLFLVGNKLSSLSSYEGIPHLLTPIIDSPKETLASLKWAIDEMSRRYKHMANAAVRGLDQYNQIVDQQQIQGPKFPRILFVIEDIDTLMKTGSSLAEEYINRICALGHSAGIYIVVATNHPAMYATSGFIKRNFSSKIVFATNNSTESRIVINTSGAEKLVGNGDMLYCPLGQSTPERIQACFVSSIEEEKTLSFYRENYENSYDTTVVRDIKRNLERISNDDIIVSNDLNEDELIYLLVPEAVDIILEAQQASVSLLQRRLRIGYARAARVIDKLEALGIVGEFRCSKSREILITKDQWQKLRSSFPI